MKTFKEVVERKKLEIYYDNNCESPREWDNLGIFVSKSIGDDQVDSHGQVKDEAKELMSFMEELAEEKDFSNVGEHIAEAQKQKPEYMIFPINKYEHSSISLTVGVRGGFDNCTTGFYFVNIEKGEAKDENYSREKMLDIIAGEMETLTKWINGEVYGFNLYDDEGEEVDSVSGFYDIDDIKSDLPEEWIDEDLSQYLVNN